MCKLDDFLSKLEEIAPLSLSQKMIECGAHDNSGIIVKVSDKVEKILFSLDLSESAINKAIELGCDTIVTHHPAIYYPIKTLEFDGENKDVLLAIKNNLNIISMHLNLDIAKLGIDHFLSVGLGGKNQQIIDVIVDEFGYGRKTEICQQSLDDFVSEIKRNFGSEKIVYYGQKPVKNIASFCGSGAGDAVKAIGQGLSIDTVITSDVAHHQLKELIEANLNVVIIPHYVSEQYGFNKFYELVLEKLQSKQKAFYFIDHRFM